MAFPLLALLLVILGLLIWRAVTRERRGYSRFKTLRDTRERQKVYRTWLIEAVLVMGGLTAATLLAAWPQVPQVLAEAQAWAPIAALRGLVTTPLGTLVTVLVGVVVVAALVVPVLLLRGSVDEVPAIGDIRALLPRTRAELPYGAGLAVQAGVLEELMFRFALPALVFGIVGNAIAALLFCAVVFGMLHLYQGVVGVSVATVLGLIFVALYLVTGTILVPIALHAIIDLRSLVLIPIALGGAGKKEPQADS